jgi:hypothetical protein
MESVLYESCKELEISMENLSLNDDDGECWHFITICHWLFEYKNIIWACFILFHESNCNLYLCIIRVIYI